jgi:hypothetical protein
MPSLTRSDRTAKVDDALAALPTAIADAKRVEKSGAAEAEIHAAWEVVEMLGATVHRQSRILAGKSRGG